VKLVWPVIELVNPNGVVSSLPNESGRSGGHVFLDEDVDVAMRYTPRSDSGVFNGTKVCAGLRRSIVGVSLVRDATESISTCHVDWMERWKEGKNKIRKKKIKNPWERCAAQTTRAGMTASFRVI
jgi:hypothetical protein